MFVPAAASPLRGSTASFIRIARHQAFRRHALRAHVRWLAAVADNAKSRKKGSLACKATIDLDTNRQILIFLQCLLKLDITR